MKLELRYWLAVLRLRALLFALVAILIVVVATVLAVKLPTTYRSSAQLLVENPQIPNDLAASTVRTDVGEQLQIIQQQLQTRQNLLDVADRLGLFPAGTLPEEIVQDLRRRISVRLTGGRGQATILSVSAQAGTGEMAAGIANDLVSQFMAAESSFRSNVAEETLDFFEAERTRLSKDLDILSQRILDYQNKNSDALPDSLDYRLGRQGILQERLADVQRDLSRLRDQRRRLEALAARSDSSITNLPGVAQTPEQEELQNLRTELDRARAILSDQNPQISILKSRIEQLEKRISDQAKPNAISSLEPDESSAPLGMLDVQLQDVAANIESFEIRGAALEAEIASLQDSIERTPANAIALAALERDLGNARTQYEHAVDRLSTAATGERIEVLSKGQRLVLIEQANVPASPFSPNRPLILVAGLVAALAMGLAAVALAEMLRPNFRRSSEITNALSIKPLATLPYIATPGERMRRRGLRIALLIVILAAVPAAIWIIESRTTVIERVVEQVRERLNR